MTELTKLTEEALLSVLSFLSQRKMETHSASIPMAALREDNPVRTIQKL